MRNKNVRKDKSPTILGRSEYVNTMVADRIIIRRTRLGRIWEII